MEVVRHLDGVPDETSQSPNYMHRKLFAILLIFVFVILQVNIFKQIFTFCYCNIFIQERYVIALELTTFQQKLLNFLSDLIHNLKPIKIIYFRVQTF